MLLLQQQSQHDNLSQLILIATLGTHYTLQMLN